MRFPLSVDETSLRFLGSLPVPAGLAVALPAAALIWWLVWRQSRSLAGIARYTLPTLRAAVVAIALALLIGPVLHHRETIGQLGQVTIVVDGSESMTRTDDHMDANRKLAIAESLGWIGSDFAATGGDDQRDETVAAQFDDVDRHRRAIESLTTTLLPKLANRHDITLRRLDAGGTQPLDLGSVPNSFSAVTDLTSGLDEKSSATAASENGTSDEPNVSSSRSAIVLLTDGQHNSGESPLARGRILAETGVPVHTVSFGAATAAPDLALRGISVPQSVGPTDRLRGELQVFDSLHSGTPITATVMHEDRVVWSNELTSSGAGLRTIPFEFDAETLKTDGEGGGVERSILPVRLTASLSPVDAEADQSNNTRTTSTAITLSNQRVLLLDGRPRWETRYLRNALDRDPQWKLTTVIAGPTVDSPLPRGPGGFPATRDELFAFDIIILGELPVSLLSADEQVWLAEFVQQRGGGLIAIDSPRGQLRSLPAALDELPPIRWTETPPVTTTALGLTLRGESVNALSLQPTPDGNRRFWRTLPPPRRLVDVETLPGAETLVEGIAGNATYPAIVTRPSGAGRVAYFAFDETWRWRYRAADRWHQRFWNQMLRFVLPEPFAVRDEAVAIDSGPVRHELGESFPIRVQLLGDLADGSDRVVEAVISQVTDDERREEVAVVELSADGTVPGLYRGEAGPFGSGRYVVSVRTPGYSADESAAASTFTVDAVESDEQTETAANETLLRELADVSGGISLREENIADLIDALAPLSTGRIIETDTPLGQSFWWYFTILGLLTGEWLLRKRAGLL